MKINAIGSLSLEYQLHKDKFYTVPANESLKAVAEVNKTASQKVAGIHNNEARESQFMIKNDDALKDLIRGNLFGAYA